MILFRLVETFVNGSEIVSSALLLVSERRESLAKQEFVYVLSVSESLSAAKGVEMGFPYLDWSCFVDRFVIWIDIIMVVPFHRVHRCSFQDCGCERFAIIGECWIKILVKVGVFAYDNLLVLEVSSTVHVPSFRITGGASAGLLDLFGSCYKFVLVLCFTKTGTAEIPTQKK